MFTTHNSVEEVVLKSAAFYHAMKQDATTALSSLPHATRRRAPVLSDSERGPSCLQKAPEEHLTSTTIERPSFTFRLPARRTGATYLTDPFAPTPPSQQHRTTGMMQHNDTSDDLEGSHPAQSALRAALQRHEDALRAWANEPLRHIAETTNFALPTPSPHALTKSSTAPAFSSRVLSTAHPVLGSHNGAVSSPMADGRATSKVVGAAASTPSRAVLALTEPYCRVRAKDSLAGIGLPCRSSVAAPADNSVNADGTRTLNSLPQSQCLPSCRSQNASAVEEGYVASQSSLSSVTSAPRPEAQSNRAASSKVSSVAAEKKMENNASSDLLLPYQLPLHLKYEALVSSTLAVHAAAGRFADVDDGREQRSTFLREQASRYAQWRNRQAAMLHQLAPNMWDRALPPYAALDRVPQVMDADLRNSASVVQKYRHDSGVVFV